jgi:hypothetical protein
VEGACAIVRNKIPLFTSLKTIPEAVAGRPGTYTGSVPLGWHRASGWLQGGGSYP